MLRNNPLELIGATAILPQDTALRPKLLQQTGPPIGASQATGPQRATKGEDYERHRQGRFVASSLPVNSDRALSLKEAAHRQHVNKDASATPTKAPTRSTKRTSRTPI